MRGIDASNHQGNIVWPAVKGDGYEFAYMKATDGPTYTDHYFPVNWHDARRVGLMRGAYHYAKPGQGPPETQAHRFVQTVEAQGLDQDDFLVLDFEDPDVAANPQPAWLKDWAVKFLDTVKSETGRVPLFYTFPGYWPFGALDYPLILSNFTNKPNPVPVKGYEWTIWQHSNKGNVSGIKGNVDLNVSKLGREDLGKLVIPAYSGGFDVSDHDELYRVRDTVIRDHVTLGEVKDTVLRMAQALEKAGIKIPEPPK